MKFYVSKYDKRQTSINIQTTENTNTHTRHKSKDPFALITHVFLEDLNSGLISFLIASFLLCCFNWNLVNRGTWSEGQ